MIELFKENINISRVLNIFYWLIFAVIYLVLYLKLLL